MDRQLDNIHKQQLLLMPQKLLNKNNLEKEKRNEDEI
jgi:hypothetical protein